MTIDLEIEALLERYREPAIMLHRPYPIPASADIRSHVGGLPSLPDEVDWPRNRAGQPLHFLAQIDCAELPPVNSALPDHGTLYFFALIDEEMSWCEHEDNDGVRVVYTATRTTEKTPLPHDLMPIEAGWSDYEKKILDAWRSYLQSVSVLADRFVSYSILA